MVTIWQPHAGQIATHFVREQLPYTTFDHQGITNVKISPSAADLRFHDWFMFLMGTTLVEFFLKPILCDHAFDTPGTDHEARLAKLLGDYFDGRLGIEETMPDDLPHDFASSARLAFGAMHFTQQPCGAFS